MTLIEQIRESIERPFLLYEEKYKALLSTDNSLLAEIFAHISANRGKQLRPMLAMLCAELCYGCNNKTISSAAALEVIHTASLIHDDVVDMSAQRRGRESVNYKWSNKIAVLAGDFLLTRAIREIIGLRNQEITNIILSMAGSLAVGEIEELHHNSSMWISEKQYLEVIRHKTAMLFAACAECGAVSAGASAKQQSALRSYGENLGLCFQMKDDELDFSDSEEIGKPRMSDVRDGKATLPLIVSLERAPRFESDEIKRLSEQPFTADTEQEIKSCVLRYDGLRYARQRMEEYRGKALEALSAFRESTCKDSLISLLNYSINRLY